MKCTIPEISWHNREPVLSVDISPLENDFYRLATGGSDNLILIWQLKTANHGAVDVDILSELTRHQRAVNAVRWSPNGEYLASGDDDANIILWQLKTDNIPSLDGESNNKETWIIYKILRCHKEDVYDICWSPNGNKLLSGSVDNTAIIWDIHKGKNEQIISDHKSFVQGVAWDPKNEFVATLSSDRFCRVISQNGRKIRARIGRGTLPVDESHVLYNKEVKYFHDDTFRTFFRRLNFSPDGSILIIPSGCVETEDCKNAMYGTYLFTLDELKKPAAILPTSKQCSIAVKCCPLLFELRPNGPKPYIDLPYRIIIAVATDSDVILYDTQQTAPFAHLQKVHYTRLTDITWSSDGLLLVASSTDGFITLVTFDPDELGITYVKEESEHETSVMDCPAEVTLFEEKQPEIKIVPKPVEAKPKIPTFLEQWAKKGPKRKADIENSDSNSPKKLKNDGIEILDQPQNKVKLPINSPKESKNDDIECIEITDSPDKKVVSTEIKTLIPKRITPTTINSVINDESKLTIQATTDKKVAQKRITPITIESAIPKDGVTKDIKEEHKGGNGGNRKELKGTVNIEVNKIIPRRITPIKIAATVTKDTRKDCIVEETIGVNRKEPTIHKKIISPAKLEDNTEKLIAQVIDISTTKDQCDSSTSKIEDKKLPPVKILPLDLKEVQLEKTALETNSGDHAVEAAPLSNKHLNIPATKLTLDIIDVENFKLSSPGANKKTETCKRTPKDKLSSDKKSPGNKQSSNKKKLKTTPVAASSRMSLLNFFKPVTQDHVKTEVESIAIDSSDDENRIKIKTKSLLKNEKQTLKDLNAKGSQLNEVFDLEDTCEAPEDFCLQIEESMDTIQAEAKENDSKEDKMVPEIKKDKSVELIRNEIKTARRIPLITLSSPKSKKKKTET